MKIFHVITLSSLGGAQSVVVNLANHQVSENDVYVLSSADGDAWKALDPRVKVIKISQLKRKISLLDIIVFLRLLYYRFKYNPDVIHLHSSKIGIIGRIAFSPFKTLYTIHGFDSIRCANRKFLFLEKILKNWCRFIVAVSKYDLENLRSENIKKNVLMIYNGAKDYSDVQFVHHSLVKLISEKRKVFKHIIMTIARDDAPKQPELFRQIAQKNLDYFFVWIGNSQAHINTDNLHWAGTIPKAYLLLKYADLFILTSGFEGLPMSILESFSFAKPVISSNVGGCPEILNGKNGKAVNNSVKEFSDAIKYFFADPYTYKQACLAARRTFDVSFGVTVMANEYMALYKKICKGE